MENNFKGFSLFNDIKSRKLAAYNRLQTMIQIEGDLGYDLAKKYAEKLTDAQRADVLFLGEMAKKFGMEEIKKIISKENG